MKHLLICVNYALVLVAPWIQAQEIYGKATDPVVAEVLGMQIRTSDAEEMVWVI